MSKTIQAMFQNVSTIHRGQEIELQSRVSLSQKGQGGKTSSKKEMKIHLICEHFRNRVKFGLPEPYLYFVFVFEVGHCLYSRDNETRL